MTRLQRICVVTGSRADYSYLSEPIRQLKAAPDFEAQLIVTGQHLTPAGKVGLAEIVADGFGIDAHVDMILTEDNPAAVGRSLGFAVAGLADAVSKLSPDLVIVLGDRYEILAAAQAALIAGIPVAHLAGGDITEGAFDDAIRHATTKLAHLHFPTNDLAAKRIVQMGEDPQRVFCVGSTSIDRIMRTTLLSRREVFARVGIPPQDAFYVVTFHPVTLDGNGLRECDEMLAALDLVGPDTSFVFTGVNADPGAMEIYRRLEDFCRHHRNATLVHSLGPELYFSAVSHADAVIGNSSSGIYEAPSFRVPTVNIGNRQKGRFKGASVIDAPGDRAAILAALRRAKTIDRTTIVSPFGDGGATKRILAALREVGEFRSLLSKQFYSPREIP